MLLYVCFLLCVHIFHSSAEIIKLTTQQHADAVLTCPHAQGDVTWSRAIKGDLVTLLTISNGHVSSSSERFSSRNNKELLIRNVVESDTSLYLCNEKKTAYLQVTTDPNMVDPEGQTVTGRKDDPDQKVTAGGADTAPPSDLWKVPVGVLAGAALVLLSMLILRLWKAKKAARDTSTVLSEVVYEEIGHSDMEPGPTPESEVETPYCCSEVSYQPNTSTAPYSTLCRPKPEGHASDTCMYYLTQNPLQMGSSCQSSP